MVGKEYVYYRSIIDMKNLSQCGRWGIDESLFETRLEIEKNLSAFWVDGKRTYVTANNISSELKFASGAMDYPSLKGIPIKRVDTYSLRAGGANDLSLAGYIDRDIQNMGRWTGEKLKEYIREELHCFPEGMSTAMEQYFKFFNIDGGAYSKLVGITSTVATTSYQPLAGSA